MTINIRKREFEDNILNKIWCLENTINFLIEFEEYEQIESVERELKEKEKFYISTALRYKLYDSTINKVYDILGYNKSIKYLPNNTQRGN